MVSVRVAGPVHHLAAIQALGFGRFVGARLVLLHLGFPGDPSHGERVAQPAVLGAAG